METKKIKLPFKIKRPVLGLGGQTKNTLCFLRGEFAYISVMHQDLSNPQNFSCFEKDTRYFLKKRPKIIAYDLHPDYQSSKYALSLDAGYLLRAIQHHHAHIVSCMVENGLKDQKVIGVAFDGTGLGPDNKLWGAEFLICDYKNFKRAAHLKEVPLLGGERAILEPWRLSAVWTGQVRDQKKWQVLQKMSLLNFNSPLSSSMGRLFDAVASLVLKKEKAGFEAELAIALEQLAARWRIKTQVSGYRFQIIKNAGEYILDPSPMFKEILTDLKLKKPKEQIAWRFHLTVAAMVQKTSLVLRKEYKINKIVLSGGVFQNRLLSGLILDLLFRDKFEVFMHKHLPSSDAGLSLGQAVIANARS